MRHLFASDEMLGHRLLALHNLSFLLGLMRTARTRLSSGTFDSWCAEWLRRYRAAPGPD
jgi:queuine tRNA-ribosyltransferase